jgi:hypothetical protein
MKKRKLWLPLLLLLLALPACQTQSSAAALPEQDAQILDRLPALFEDVDYGLAPLLLDEHTQVVVQNGVAYLDYPDQPDDPRAWQSTECFGYAYTIRNEILSDERVSDVALGLVTLPSGLGEGKRSYHVAAWVTFRDGHTIPVDLSPLAADPIGPRYDAGQLVSDQAELDDQFQRLRQGVNLNQARAMLVTRRDGRLYYLLVSVLVMDDEYQFTLYGHRIRPATGEHSLRFDSNAVVGLRFRRSAFHQVQPTVAGEGPNAFNAKPHLLTRQGDEDAALNAVLDEHLYLLWHLVTKFEEPDDAAPIGLHLQITDGQQPVVAVTHIHWADRDFSTRPTSKALIFMPANEPLTLTVTAPGYRPWTQSLTPTKSLNLVVRLIRE